jgi:SAM-dependent methyltransferase
MSASDDPLDRKDHIQQIVQYQPTADIFVNLIQAIEERIGDFLEGRISGGDLLFSNESMVNLWNSYFNNQFYGYSLINHGVAYGIAKWFSHTKGTSMLEVGSGTSGASTMVFQMLRDNNLLDSMNTILLTDVVPSLLDQGRRNIEQRISDPPHFVQEVLDINKSLGGQGLEEKSFDIIFGVNVLHVARDLAFSLEELYQRLHKGGVLIIAETIRPATNMPMHQEFIFNLLENYHDVELDGETRPCHGFLTRDQWVKNFEKAGFRNIEYLKEPDGHEEIDFDIKPLHAFMVLKGQK